jgi:hypothetical protein
MYTLPAEEVDYVHLQYKVNGLYFPIFWSSEIIIQDKILLVVVYARTSYVQFWVRIYGLSQEYWRSRILFEKASGCAFGHYAHVLVDVDIS